MKHHTKRKPHRFRELRRQLPPGSPPGVLQEVPDALTTKVTLFAYSPDEYIEKTLDNFSTLNHYLDRYPVVWVHIAGFKNIHLIEEIGTLLNLHNLSLEDAINAHHRSKVEAYAHYIFIIAQMVHMGEKLHTEQISMFMLGNCLVTFQESHEDCLEPVRIRMKKSAGRIRTKGVDYLAYAVLDSVIDNYYPALEQFNDMIERLEVDILSEFHTHQIVEIHAIKNSIMVLHRVIWPMREVVAMLMREDSSFITENTYKYLRDCYDHIIQLEELTAYCRDLTAGLMDLHLSFSNQRMNEIMKFLTMVSTIFIPISFIAGLYGMNFHETSPFNMPELGWRYGYFFALGLMLCCAGGMFYLFKRRGWIAKTPAADVVTHDLTS